MFEKREQSMQDRMMKKEVDMNREQNAFNQISDDDAVYLHEREAKADLTRWQQDLADELEELRHDFLGEILIENGWKSDPKIKIPLMNKVGAYKLIALVRQYIGRNLMMSNYNEERIFSVMRCLGVTLVTTLGSSYDAYGINPIDLKMVKLMIMDKVEQTHLRALNNGERRYLNTIAKRVEAFTEHTEPQKKKKLFGFPVE